MIDLTPLDVRGKRGDFKRLMRGYDPQEVDTFLELVAERLEELTRETIALRERTQSLQQQVDSQTDREQAVQEALVTAQELRADIRGQAQREAEGILKDAETEGRRMIAEAEAEVRTKLRGSERRLEQVRDALEEVERRRARFLKEFRQLLERELDVVEVEETRRPLEERAIELDLGAKREAEKAPAAAVSPSAVDHDAPTVETRVVEEPPTPDAPVDELAAAHESRSDAVTAEQAGLPEQQAELPVERSTLAQAIDAALPAREPPPPPKLQDNLLLYLDTDDDA